MGRRRPKLEKFIKKIIINENFLFFIYNNIMSTQTLKAALSSRVRNDQVSRLASSRQDLGEGLMCPASAGFLQHDVYGRPSNQNNLLTNNSSCSHYTLYNAKRRIGIENN